MKHHLFFSRYQVLTSILFLLLTVCFQTTSEESILNPDAIAVGVNSFSLPSQTKKIAFTFDDGPYPEFTEKLIEILKAERVKATFFIVGEMGVRYPYLLRSLSLSGHEVAGHTFTHPNLTRVPPVKVREELEKTRLLIREFTGKDSFLFRPPGGNYDEKLKETCSSLGYKAVLWTVFPQDHLNLPVEEIYQRVTANAHPEGIILLHSGKENTLRALPGIIHTLKERGYIFVTVSELLESNLTLLTKSKASP